MKVAIYCRLSDEDRNKQSKTDDSNSIQNQKTMLMQYALSQGWEIYNIYSDDDYAGADRRRPEFNRLLQDAEKRKFDIVLCKTQSRFTRELELVEKYIHGLFPMWGIRFISIVDNADTFNAGNKKSRQINGLVNEWYLEDMSDNIRSVLKNRRENGFHIGSFALYGYVKDPNRKGHLLIDEESASVVRQVFTLFAQGYGKTAIARMLNDRGIPNPTEYKRLMGLRYKQPSKTSTLWKYSAIARMLTNEIYIGNMVQGKYGSISYKTKQNKPRPKSEWYVVEGTHEPIIDRELWNRVQSLIQCRAKPFKSGEIGLFARKAVCMGCGYALRSTKSNGRHYLRCPTRHVSKSACDGAFISAEKMEEMVIDELHQLIDNYLDKSVLEKNISPRPPLVSQDSIIADISIYKKRIAQLSNALQELYLDKVNGLVSPADYNLLSASFAHDREHLEKQITRQHQRLEGIRLQQESGHNPKEIIERYTHFEHLTRAMIELLIDHIVVGKRITGTRDIPIEIHWNF